MVSVPSFIFMMVTQIGSFELMHLTKTLGSNFEEAGQDIACL